MSRNVTLSPVRMDPEKDIPNVSFTDFILAKMKNLNLPANKPWMVDTISEQTVKFADVELHSRKIASFLARRGFIKGDTLLFATHGFAYSCLIQFAGWRLGGITKGTRPNETIDSYKKILRGTKCKFMVIDDDTGPLLRATVAELDWEVTLICIGDDVRLRSTITMEKMLADDGTAFPNDVTLDPKNDVFYLSDTCDWEKVGAVHHCVGVAFLAGFHRLSQCMLSEAVMAYSHSCGSLAMGHAFLALTQGTTYFHIPKCKEPKFVDLILHYKPNCIVVCPRGAYLICQRIEELFEELRERDILKSIILTGRDPGATNCCLIQYITFYLPRTRLITMYTLPYAFHVSIGYFNPGALPATKYFNGVQNVSCGKLMPMVEGGVLHPVSKEYLPVGSLGEIVIRSASRIRGYFEDGKYNTYLTPTGKLPWISTGHFGCFDEDGNIFVQEKMIHTESTFTELISPVEIETLLQSHPCVLAAGVLGLPLRQGVRIRSLALVVLKPGATTEVKELIQYTARRLPSYKHLDNIHLVKELPLDVDGQLDREQLVMVAEANFVEE